MIQKKYQEIIKCLEENIENQKDLEYAKKQFSDFTVYFLNLLNAMQESYENRMVAMEKKFKIVEDKVNNIEKELFEDFENLETINCPYCDFSFMMELEEKKQDVECPECGNIIELDWEENESENDDDM